MSGYRINDEAGAEAATAPTLVAARTACRVLTEETGKQHTWMPIMPWEMRKHVERIDRRIKHLAERIAERGEDAPISSHDRAERGALLWVRGIVLAAHEEDLLGELHERRPG